MKRIMRRTAAALTAAVLCAAVVGCSRKNENSSERNMVGAASDGESVASEDLPYGAMMTSLSSEREEKLCIDVDFDARYFVKEGEEYPEVFLAAEYLKALQEKDEAKMKEIFYEPYLIQQVLERNYKSVQEFLDKYYESLSEKLGGDFKFTYFTIDTCLNENESDEVTHFSSVDARLDTAAEEKLSQKVTSRKVLYMDVTVEDKDGNSHQLNSLIGSDISVYVYQIDGKYYLL